MRVAVIGAGPVGSWIAARLAEQGEKVTVFERRKSPGGKACSGLVSERIWDFFPENGELVENKIECVNIHFPKKAVKVKFRPHLLALDRPGLDRYAAKLATAAGVKILFGSTFEKLREGRDSVSIRCGGKEHEFDRVIGCDGAFSAVRAAYADKKPRFRMGMQCFQPKRSEGNTADAWPTNNGFFWKVPRKEAAEWGIFENEEMAGKMWKEFAAGRGLGGLQVNAAMIPEGVLTTGSKKVTLCGDAAGLTKPWSGGGILWGLTAAGMLLDCWPDFARYERNLKVRFGAKIALGRTVTRTVTSVGKFAPQILPKKFDTDWLV